MRILYIDTTTNYLYSALWEDGKIVQELKEKLDKDLSVFTLQKISEMMNNVNWNPKDIDKILVVNGPGSFTGIRVGVTIAKTYAYGLNKQISTVSSLKAMACSTTKDCPYRIPIIDARRGYVFAAIYDKENNAILKEQYVSLAALKCTIESLPGDYTVITNNDIDVEEKEEYNPNFDTILNKYHDQELENPHLVNPIYLKLTEAEEKQNIGLI